MRALAPLLCLLALATPLGAEPPPRAADLVRAEVLTGWREPGAHMAGLRLRLAEKWKTYWRSPGEAGIPPSFDFTASDNAARVEVLWPAPRVFTLNGLRTIGYAREVVLPIRVTPRDPSRDVALRGTVEMGICRDICLPVTLDLAAVLPASGGGGDPALSAAIASVPETIRAAGVRCRTEPITDGLRLTAELATPRVGPVEGVVLETADPTLWVSETEVAQEGPRLTAVADLVPAARAPFALDRSAIRLTVLGDAGAVELQGCTGG